MLHYVNSNASGTLVEAEKILTGRCDVILAESNDEERRRVFGYLVETVDLPVRCFKNGADLVEAANDLSYGVFFCAENLSDGKGLDLIEKVARRGHYESILISESESFETAVRALRLGVTDVLTKPGSRETVAPAIELALGRCTAWIERNQRHEYALERMRQLTPRELELVNMLAGGASNKDIARSWDISVRTVENHRANLMRKAGAESLAELIQLAILAAPDDFFL